MHLFLGHGFSVCYLLVSVVVWCTWVLGMGMHSFLDIWILNLLRLHMLLSCCMYMGFGNGHKWTSKCKQLV